MSEKVRKLDVGSDFVAPEDEEPTFQEWVGRAQIKALYILI